jgi:tRNA A37 threonylcarbamoyladenosine dehydratase
MDRFKRVEQLIGAHHLQKLRAATVAVFGLGAVGSFALEALARSGIGRFILVDFDEVRTSNFNRQLFAVESSKGRLKAHVAQDRVLAVNPAAQVRALTEFADKASIQNMLSIKPDVVIDAIDSLKPKTELIEYCMTNRIPIVSSMGAGDKTDPFLIRVGDLSETEHCPLARRVRKRLRRAGIEEGVRCVYSPEIPHRSHAAAEEEFYKRGRERVSVGTICYMTGMFGLYTAYEALRILAGGKVGARKQSA